MDSSAEGGDLLGKLVTPFLSIEDKMRGERGVWSPSDNIH